MGDVPVDLLAARFPHYPERASVRCGRSRRDVTGTDGSRTELTYDANGQVASKTVVRGTERTTWKYGWNARGELASSRRRTARTGRIATTASGRRIEKRSPTGDTWRYVWMGAVLLHTLKNGEVAETYVHEPGGTCPILRDDGAIHFILPDQNDSPSEEVTQAASSSGLAEGHVGRGAPGTSAQEESPSSASGTTPRAGYTTTAFATMIRRSGDTSRPIPLI